MVRVEQESVQAPVFNFHREHAGDVAHLRVLDKRFAVRHLYMEEVALAVQGEVAFIV